MVVPMTLDEHKWGRKKVAALLRKLRRLIREGVLL